ncbi:hypothetical protein BaRGS_00012197 [Batillaria attramentaria]|uniref:Uncharacterized protein n=1 Tax=Batillaria attramentaria TaxID=370345 RepID=A0ABD0LB27_9CAEN
MTDFSLSDSIYDQSRSKYAAHRTAARDSQSRWHLSPAREQRKLRDQPLRSSSVPSRRQSPARPAAATPAAVIPRQPCSGSVRR